LGKFCQPRLPRVHVRERLFRLIDDGLQGPAVWIAGCAGAGKTTLIGSYLDSRRRPVLWYQVDRGDNDATGCCQFLQRAAGRTVPPAASSVLPLDALAGSDLRAFFRRYFAGLYGGWSAPSTLVFDNAQEALSAATFRALLVAAIDEAPAAVRLLIASRVRPPKDFARLLANGDLVVLDPDELPFNEDESLAVQRLARPSTGTRSLGQMSRLHQLSRGWPAGLKLLLQLPQTQAEQLDAGTTADQAALFSYLAGEIFEQQPAAVQHILLQLAHFPRMSAGMAEALCGSAQAAEVLAAMHHDSVLTTLHGKAEQAQYEFHPLLREFLRRRALAQLSGDQQAGLRRRAAALLVAAGDRESAAQLLIDGRHWDELRELIGNAAESLLRKGAHRTLADWLQALPRELRDPDPWLCYWHGEAELHFAPPLAQERFARAYRLFRERGDGDGAFLAWSASVDLICLEWADFSQLDAWLDEAASLRACFGDPPAALHERCTASMFSALMFRRPQDPGIHAVAARLLGLVERCADPGRRLLLGCNLHIYYTVCIGRNGELDRLMNALRPPDATALPSIFAVLWQALQAINHWRCGRCAATVTTAAQALRQARAHGLRVWDFLLAALEVYGCLNAGLAERARLALQRFERSIEPRRKIDLAHFHYLSALERILAGDGAGALAAVEASNAIADRYGGTHQHALGRLALAQALHACGRADDAWQALADARRQGELMQGEIMGYQADLCAASFALAAGDEARCAGALERAFRVGARLDFRNHMHFFPAEMARLCAFALEHAIVPDFARRLIAIHRLAPPHIDAPSWPWPVQVHTLGRFSLVVGGQPVSAADGLQQKKPLEILRVLIALGGRDIRVGDAISAIWPATTMAGDEPRAPARRGRRPKALADEPVANGPRERGAFDISLSRLRRILAGDGQADDLVLVEDGLLRLNPDRCRVDLWSCQRSLGKVRSLLDAPAPPPDEALLASARELLRHYPGDFLAREEALPCVVRLRDELRQQVVSALADLAGILCRSHLHDAAARLYERAVAIDPCRERLYRDWMICLQQQGESAEGLRVFQRCREMLADRLGSRPSEATEAVARALAEAAAGTGPRD
jgi:ATP/maltotriose-dependent transcriptional regulator MalT/DNA-binding SARP family transcriptional activator